MSPDTILKTKLFIPPLREGMISRSRLVEIINKGIKKKVLFLSAPAGFGKSTLMVQWVAQSKKPVAWVSLDKTENDPVSFLSYLITSVQSIYKNLGEAILGVLKSPGSPPAENLLHAWINEISEHADEFVLVLDDFHHIQNQSVIELFINLTEHQPAQLHLLLASRADLPISFSRIRARGELTDLGITDLRFTPEETIVYLQNQLGENISEEDAEILNERTEGWIVSLQMAVLSMKSSEDISQYVAQFSAQNRYITDYLLDEVLLRQPEEITKFLLATSVLERYTAPLCNHVVGIQNGQEIIENIERSGLFVIPLDTTRTWYRYHHLFAELLRKRLDESQFFQREELHRKAFEWFASREMLEECIDHAFAVSDYDLVIEQIEKSLNQIMAQGQFRNYLAWVDKVPKDYLKQKPRLEIVKIFMLHEMGRLDERDKQLKCVDDLLGPFPEDIDRCNAGEITNYGILASIKAIIYAGNYFLVDEATGYAGLANKLLPEDHMIWRILALGAIPFSNRVLGNYSKAREGFNQVLELALHNGFTFQAFMFYSALTKIYLETGKLKLAIVTCQKALDMDVKHGANLPFAKLAYLIMGELMYQSGELLSAESYIDAGLEHVVRHGEIYSIIDGYSTLARSQLSSGDVEQSLALIREMKEVIGELSPSKNALKIVNAWEAYIGIFIGQLEQPEKWIKESGFDELDGTYLFDFGSHTYVGIYRVSQTPIKFYSDFIGITLARLCLALDKLDDGLRIIDEVFLDASTGGRMKHKIECMIIKSILLLKINRMSEAANVFYDAIRFAAAEGFVQMFLNEGAAIKGMLESIKRTGNGNIEEQVFVLQLLEKIQFHVRQTGDQSTHAPDQLTGREIEVLKCLASGSSYSQAAEKLSVSRNTLKTHTKRIYQKLGVNGLLQALNKAKDLNLLN